METLLKNKSIKITDHTGTVLQADNLLDRISRLAFCITDSNGNFAEINEAYTKLYGYEEKELIGQHFTKVVPSEYKAYATDVHNRFIAGEVEMPAEWEVQNKHGKKMRIFAEAIRVEDDNSTSKVTVIEKLEDLD